MSSTILPSRTEGRSLATWLLGGSIGVGTHALFAFTVWHLFWFLRDGGGRPARSLTELLLCDLLLALQFAVPHSLLLLPATRRWITRRFPSEFYGCLYCVVTCLSLLILFAGWRTSSSSPLWQATGSGEALVRSCFYGSWIGLLYSLHLTGLGYQTGLTPWWHWMRQRPLPPRQFDPHRGAYRFLRHPVYLCFLGLIWFTTRMTLEHSLLTASWTLYILVGSYLKDERLAYYYGQRYREYQARVPGYPLLLGPLGRRAWAAPDNPPLPLPTNS